MRLLVSLAVLPGFNGPIPVVAGFSRTNEEIPMLYTRRELGQLALAGLPSAGLLSAIRLRVRIAALAKPESKWAGVQVGMNVPYNFGMGNYMTGDEILSRCVQLGVSGVELRMQPVELFMGSPEADTGGRRCGAQTCRAWRRPRRRSRPCRRRSRGADARAGSGAESRGRGHAEMAPLGADEQGQGIPQADTTMPASRSRS